MVSGLKVFDFMEKNVYSLKSDHTVREALYFMLEKNVSGLPITDDSNKLIGFVTDDDFMKYLFNLGNKRNFLFASTLSEMSEKNLEEIVKLKDVLGDELVIHLAKKNPIYVFEMEDYDEACRLLQNKKIRKLPVINQEGKLVGVVSRSIILKYLIKYAQKTELF